MFLLFVPFHYKWSIGKWICQWWKLSTTSLKYLSCHTWCSLIPRLLIRKNGLATYPGSNYIWIWRQKDYSCIHTSHEYWIMHVIFDQSHVTVMCKCVVVASKTRYRLILDGCFLVICRCTACSTLALAHWCWSAWLTVSTKPVLYCYSWTGPCL